MTTSADIRSTPYSNKLFPGNTREIKAEVMTWLTTSAFCMNRLLKTVESDLYFDKIPHGCDKLLLCQEA